MLRWQIQIWRQIFFMWIPEVFFRAHPPEGCSFFHSRISDQILMFKCCFHIFRCLKGNAVFTCFPAPVGSSVRGWQHASYLLPPSVQYGVIHPSQVQTLHDLPILSILELFLQPVSLEASRSCGCSNKSLVFPKTMSFLLLKASIHYKTKCLISAVRYHQHISLILLQKFLHIFL